MKPSRSKREGRADRAREIQRLCRRGREAGLARTDSPRAAGPVRSSVRSGGPAGPPAASELGAVHFSRARRPRPVGSVRRQRPAGWGSSGQAGPPTGGSVGRAYSPAVFAPAARPRKGRRAAPAPPGLPLRRPLGARRSRGGRVGAGPPGGTEGVRPPRPFSVAAGGAPGPSAGVGRATAPRVRGRLSRALPTRLETRTKESIGPASRGAADRGPEAQRE